MTLMFAGREWFKNDGASAEALDRLAAVAPFQLPQSYFAVLRYSNGGEGPLPVDPWTFCLDPAEFATETEQSGTFREFFPGLFVIGSNGAGEAFALDARSPESLCVVRFDMTNCDLAESVIRMAPDFDSFLKLVGKSHESP